MSVYVCNFTYATPMQGAKSVLCASLHWKIADHMASSGAGDFEAMQCRGIKYACGVRIEGICVPAGQVRQKAGRS